MQVLQPGLWLDGRFELDRPLREGEISSTWLGREGERPVILKLASFDSDLWVRLAHEQAALTRLNSPHIPRLLHQGCQGTLLYRVLDYIPGLTLQQRLETGPLPMAEFFRLAGHLFRNLELLHAHSILHRDLKPANLVVSPLGLCMIDFGFSQVGSLATPALAGTVLYASPEAAGLLSRDVGEAADLYSAGAVLFHCLSGRPPYQGQGAGEVLRQHLTSPIPLLSRYRRGLPPGLQILLNGLLAKEPSQRYACAQAAREALESIESGASPAQARVRGGLASPIPIGWEDHLREGLRRLNQGGAWLTVAASGGGKSLLLETLATQAVQLNFRVLRGQAATKSGEGPFWVLSRPFYQLFQQCSAQELEEIRQATDLWKDELLRILPLLSPFYRSAGAHSLTEETAKNRTLLAMLSLFRAVSSLARPTLLLLDDVHWADSSSLEVLSAWHRGGAPGQLRLLAACGEESIPAELQTWERTRLLPLTSQETRRVLQSMAGNLPAEAAEWLEEYAAGNPFLLTEALRGLVDGGALRDSPTGWSLTQPFQTSLRSVGMLQGRLPVSGSEREVLRLAAILGRQFRLSPLLRLSGGSAAEVVGALDRARRQRLLWSAADGASWTFAHDRLRESLLQDVSEPQRRQLHARAASALEADEKATDFELAYHFYAAECYQQARPFALRAAAQARTSAIFGSAADHYSMALAAPAPDDWHIRLERAQCLFYAGRFALAEAAYQDLLQETTEALARGRLLLWLAEVAFSTGDLDRAQTWTAQALREMGEGRLLKPAPWTVAGTFLGRMVKLRPPGAPPAQSQEKDLLLIECLNLLGHASAHHGKLFAGLFQALVALDIAEQRVGGRQLGFEWVHHSSTVAHFKGLRLGAAAYARQGLDLLEKHSGHELQVCKALARSMIYRLHCEPVSSLMPLIQSLGPRLERTGHVFEATFHRYLASYVLLAAGQLQGFAESARQLYQLMVALDNKRCKAMALSLWARGGSQPLPESIVNQEMAQMNELDSMARVHLRTALAVSCLRGGDPESGFAHASKSQEASGPSEMITLRLVAAECLRRSAERLPRRSQKRRNLHQQAAHMLAQSRRQADFSFPFLLAPVQRELGLNFLSLGKVGQGLKLLETSLQRSIRFEHHYEAAVCRLEIARWRTDQGDAQGPSEMQQALAELAKMGAHWQLPRPAQGLRAPNQPARLDRFERLLHWGRELAAQLDEEAVWKTLWQSLTELLRCDDCQLLRADLSSQWGPPGPVSGSLVAAAVQAAGPQVADEASLDQSLSFRAVRSAMACPVLLGGQLARIVHVTHPLVAKLFEPEERQLTEFLCGLAAAACENSRMHAALRHSQTNFQSIFRAAGVGLALLSSDGSIREGNESFFTILGTGSDARQKFSDFLPADENLDITPGRDLRILRPDGRLLVCRVTISQVGIELLLTVVDATSSRLEELKRFQEEDRRWLASLHTGELVARMEALGQQVSGLDDPTSLVLAQNLTRATKNLFYSLRSPKQGQAGLIDSLHHFLDWFAESYRLQLRRQLPEGHFGDDLASVGVFRLMQEALNNVAQHADASQVEVTLQWTGTSFEGTIRDDGRGFDAHLEQAGFGLKGMRFRAELLGGQAQVTSAPGQGTEVRFRIPATASPGSMFGNLPPHD